MIDTIHTIPYGTYDTMVAVALREVGVAWVCPCPIQKMAGTSQTEKRLQLIAQHIIIWRLQALSKRLTAAKKVSALTLSRTLIIRPQEKNCSKDVGNKNGSTGGRARRSKTERRKRWERRQQAAGT